MNSLAAKILHLKEEGAGRQMNPKRDLYTGVGSGSLFWYTSNHRIQESLSQLQEWTRPCFEPLHYPWLCVIHKLLLMILVYLGVLRMKALSALYPAVWRAWWGLSPEELPQKTKGADNLCFRRIPGGLFFHGGLLEDFTEWKGLELGLGIWAGFSWLQRRASVLIYKELPVCRLWDKGSWAESHLILPKPKQGPISPSLAKMNAGRVKECALIKTMNKGQGSCF